MNKTQKFRHYSVAVLCIMQDWTKINTKKYQCLEFFSKIGVNFLTNY